MTGREVKRIRQRLAMTQQAFAEAIGVAFPTVNRWENGHFGVSPRCAAAISQFEEDKVKDKQKVQRIKLRVRSNPVKLDASITACAPDASWVDVEFDGPMENRRLYRYSENVLATKTLEDIRKLVSYEEVLFFEVL